MGGVLTDDEDGDLEGEISLVVRAFVRRGTSCPSDAFAERTENERGVPPFAAAPCLEDVEEHGEEEDDGEDDAGAEVGIVAVGGRSGAGVVGDAAFGAFCVR